MPAQAQLRAETSCEPGRRRRAPDRQLWRASDALAFLGSERQIAGYVLLGRPGGGVVMCALHARGGGVTAASTHATPIPERPSAS